MQIVIAGDSAGAGLAETLTGYLAAHSEHDVINASLTATGPDAYYADLAERVALDVLEGRHDRAILICGTGIGVAISANKVPGIRAAQCHDTYSAERAALSNNAQVITIGARVVGPELAKAIASAFLGLRFDPDGRSADNVRAIDRLDTKYSPAAQQGAES